MLDPITLISLLTLQTQTRISIAARGEQGREPMSLCCFIFSLPVTLWRGDRHGKSWEGLGCTHLTNEVSQGQWSPGPCWAPTHSTSTPRPACQAPVWTHAVHEKFTSTNSMTALTKRFALNVELSQAQESPRLGFAPKCISGKGRPPLQRSSQSHSRALLTT